MSQGERPNGSNMKKQTVTGNTPLSIGIGKQVTVHRDSKPEK
jgi:hypothetical protein